MQRPKASESRARAHAGRAPAWGAFPVRPGRRAGPKLYGRLASWWPLLSSPDDYEEEARQYARLLGAGRAKTLLELGSGGGNNAVHLKARFGAITLVDRSAGMLAVSRKLNPECRHVRGDMRRVRLDVLFDAVFVHDAVDYMATERDLRAVMTTARAHCRDGGRVVFVPDYVRETFAPCTGHGGEDGNGRSLRYLQWEWDPDPSDSWYAIDFVFALRDRRGSLRVETDRHFCGLFGIDDWLTWLRAAGFRPRLTWLEHSEIEAGRCPVFVCRAEGEV